MAYKSNNFSIRYSFLCSADLQKMAGSAREELIVSLFEAGCVKFGSFKLKTGIMSPVYFDFRVIVSYPKLMVNCASPRA